MRFKKSIMFHSKHSNKTVLWHLYHISSDLKQMLAFLLESFHIQYHPHKHLSLSQGTYISAVHKFLQTNLVDQMFSVASSPKQTINTTDMKLIKFSTIKKSLLKFNNLIIIYYTTKHMSSTKMFTKAA